MDAYTLAVILILVGVALDLAEIVVPGFFLAVPGTAAIIYGVLLAMFPGVVEEPWGPWLLAGLAAPLTLATVALYKRLSPPQKPVTASYEGLVGLTGVVVETVTGDEPRGRVRVAGDEWPAVSASGGEIPPGTRVRVVGVEGVHLIVEPLHGTEEKQ
ncbi:NfeD family protein [Pyrodictium abyssi]|uniref:NfeD-like C-terminal domain-containing protein n=1 Tax=Pyrodictium abyssi TaxID=54256 RepID=A0ABN6ZPM1_9CREN|nr:hypothetical protein PABY_17520 [Pyrodictium abyssi]